MNDVLFIALPYLAIFLAVFGSLYRYRNDRFSYSSFSSQFLENRLEFWGSVPWHYGIILILLAHLLAFLFPGLWQALMAQRERLYALEIAGFALAILTVFGLGLLIVRRLTSARVRAVTSVMDWVLLLALLAQVTLGFCVAFFYRWGSDWYLHTAVPWLVSLVLFSPRVQYVSALPWVIKLHMIGGFIIIGLFPFTRLVHLVTVPLSYLWRPYQVVIWNRRPERSMTAR